jgi:glycerate 2-kinase
VIVWNSGPFRYDQKVPKAADLLSILQSGIDAVRPSLLFPEILKNPSENIRNWLSAPRRFLLALGKASVDSARTLLSQVDCEDYFVLSPYPDPEKRLHVQVGSHPIPNEQSYEATNRLKDWFRAINTDGSLLVVLSGGTSALCVSPLPQVSLSSKMKVNELLIGSGARIQEINTVRKHLSSVKGGQLGAYYPASQTHVVVISDVIGDDLSAIGSGPFYADPSTFTDAKKVLLTYSIWNDVPEDVRQTIDSGIAGFISETPKPGTFEIPHSIIASNEIARLAAAEKAAKLGYSIVNVENLFADDIEKATPKLLQLLKSSPKRSAIICGGEVTIRVTGGGIGGRNQHLTLLMTERIRETDFSFAAAGTDGIDGNSNAAGAWADGETFRKAGGVSSFEHAVEECDSYSYFNSVGQNILTGPTGTNVMDLYIALT